MTITSTAAAAAGRSIEDGERPEPTGIMVALALTPDQASDLVLPREEFEGALAQDDLHVTLAFLGDVSEVEDPSTFLIDLLTVVRDVGRQYNTVEGEVSGVGRFTIEDGDAFYASYDAPGLSTLREDLVEGIEQSGIAVRKEHGFDPHITLAYLSEGDRTPVERVPTKPLSFSEVTVAFGASRIAVPLRKRDDPDAITPYMDREMPDTTAPNSPVQSKGKFVPFRKGDGKGDGPGVARGAYVTLGSEKGRVDLVVTSGKVPGVEQDIEGTKDDPAIRVVIYEKSDNGWKATGRKIGAKAKSAKSTFPLKSPKSGGGAKGKKDLVEILAAHERAMEAKDLPRSTVPSGQAVGEVFRRGVKSWPGEQVTALTAEEWGTGRVQMFLSVASGAVDPTEAKYLRDLDLLPEGHPHRDVPDA